MGQSLHTSSPPPGGGRGARGFPPSHKNVFARLPPPESFPHQRIGHMVWRRKARAAQPANELTAWVRCMAPCAHVMTHAWQRSEGLGSGQAAPELAQNGGMERRPRPCGCRVVAIGAIGAPAQAGPSRAARRSASRSGPALPTPRRTGAGRSVSEPRRWICHDGAGATGAHAPHE